MGRAVTYRVPVRVADPRAVRLASALGALLGRGINGHTGAVRYGMAQGRNSYAGYAFPPQLFLGWNPRRIAGTPRVAPPRLPGTSAPASELASPLSRAMATVSGARQGRL